MSWLRKNMMDIFTLAGLVTLNIPAYMHNIKLGLCVTGVSFLSLALALFVITSKGGD